MKRALVIGTRGSLLAKTQAQQIADSLSASHPELAVRLEIIKTTGDRITDAPLSRIGGKGLFTKELEVALIENKIDLAVHSLKDLPTDLPDGLGLGAVPKREVPFDALVCAKWSALDELPAGARLGTSSLRRAAQIRALRPDIQLEDLRGNIDTRIGRVLNGDIDAAILACAGLKRIGRGDMIRQELPLAAMVPAVGQGALAIEIRCEDMETTDLLAAIHDPASAAAVFAERALLAELEGGCQVPIGAYARLEGGRLHLTACVCSLDGTILLRTEAEGDSASPELLGRTAAQELIVQGAAELIAAAR
jgi:hydroxymethylbilane synthase